MFNNYYKVEEVMKLYSIMIAEDNYRQRENLKKMILSMDDSIKIYEADSEEKVLNVINDNHIDMFLIDIQLKGSSGLELALKIRKIFEYKFSLIVFVTTHIEYITQAFKETHCYDYLLKPYNRRDIESTINNMKLYENSRLKNENNIEENNKRKIILALKGSIYVEIDVDNIIFIEVSGRQCEVNTVNGIYIANNISLKKVMKMINDKNIVQSHRAFAVNIKYITRIEKIDVKLSNIYFINTNKSALLGYKFKTSILNEFEKDKILIC